MLSRLPAVLARAGKQQAGRMLPELIETAPACRRHLSSTAAAVAQPRPQAGGSHTSDRVNANGGAAAQHSSLQADGSTMQIRLQSAAGWHELPDPLEQFRASNVSIPYLEGQVVKARIIAVDQKTITLDPGYKYTQNFFKRELANVPIYAEDGTRLGIPEEYHVGDILHVRIDALETPFGDMQLTLGGRLAEAEQAKLVLARVREAMEAGTAIMGRILNPVNRGYAVGIAGIVAFLPITQCMYQTAQRIGVLQPFRVQSIVEETRNVVVYDAAKVSPTAQPTSFRYSTGNRVQARPFRLRPPMSSSTLQGNDGGSA